MTAPAAFAEALKGPLGRIVEDGAVAIGIQLTASTGDGQHADVAVGRGGLGCPLTPVARFQAYCAAKPIFAFAFIAEWLSAGRSLDDTVGNDVPLRLGLPAHTADYSVRAILQHRTSLMLPKAVEVATLSPAHMRRRIALDASLAAATAEGYSEVTGWLVLAELLNDLTSQGAQAAVNRWTRQVLGLTSTSFGLTDTEVRHVLADIDVNMMDTGGEWVPMLVERTKYNLTRFEPSFGAYSNAADLADFWRTLLDPSELSGFARQAAELMTCDTRPKAFDPGLDTRSAFGLGVMTGLPDHWGACALASTAFGHSGFLGSAFGYADPDLDLAVGCVVVGISDYDTIDGYLRPAIVGTVRAAAEGCHDPTRPTTAPPAAPERSSRARGR